MSKIKLSKIRISGLNTHYDVLLKELQKKGDLQIIANRDFSDKSTFKYENDEQFSDVFDLARIDFSIKFLENYEQKKPFMEKLLTGGKIITSKEKAEKHFAIFQKEVDFIVSECENIKEKEVRGANEMKKIITELELLQNYKNLNYRIGKSLKTETTESFVGKILANNKNKFIEALAKESNLLDLDILNETPRDVYFRLTVENSILDKVKTVMMQYKFVDADLSEKFADFSNQYIKEIISKFKSEKAEHQKILKECLEQKNELAKSLQDLKLARDFYSWQKSRSDVRKNLFKTDNLFVFEAWIPENKYQQLTHWLEQSFVGEVSVEKIAKRKDEKEPALLKNAPGIKSFQIITEMFGSPGNKEIDPTPAFAPFFALFFGICLSDVGYGTILTLVSGFFLIFSKFSREARVSLYMILICGISAILGGVALGGWFGLTTEQVPSFLINSEGDFVGQILNPMKGSGPMTFLLFTFALGMFQLLIGIIMDFIKRICSKDYIGAFADSAAWFYFLVSIIVWVFAEKIGLDKSFAVKLPLVGAGILVLTQGRSKKNIFAKLIFGVLGLYGIMDYVSNMLSYSRLMALGLATGIIGSAMNMTAGVLGEMINIPILGTVVVVGFLIFGHSLNLALSTLGAFIHSMRLQFIEFFGVFYSGGTTKFTPFACEKKYLQFKS